MKRSLAILLCVFMAISLFAGCAGSGSSSSVTAAPSQAAAGSNAPAAGEPAATGTLISETPLELTMFMEMDAKATVVLRDYSEMAVFKQMAELTNITIKFIHPPAEQGKEQFNLMVASGDLPDMAFLDTSKLNGGLAQYLADDIIIAVNDYLESDMPNLSKFLEENPTHSKQAKLDDGTLAYLPMFTISDSIMVTTGMQIRTNWLENVGMSVPTTLDEWYEVLTAFKEKDANGNGDMNDEIPFVPRQGANAISDMMKFGLPYKVLGNDFFVVDDKIGYGPYSPELKEILTMLNKWYSEGLIDPDYLSTDAAGFEAKILNDIGGSYTGTVNGNMGKFLGLWESEHPDYEIKPIDPPKAPDGKIYGTDNKSYASVNGLIITSDNKHIPETLRYMDYLYGPEGYLLTNFGIEGESYTLVDGKPQFTDAVLNDPEGIPVINALHKYGYANSNGVCLQGEEAFMAAATYSAQIDAFRVFGNSDVIRIKPNGLSATVEESNTLARIVNDTKTYSDEMINKFIMGQESMDKYDAYVETLKNMKVEEAIAIQQAMYDRYLQR